jgi:hypothetical protein
MKTVRRYIYLYVCSRKADRTRIGSVKSWYSRLCVSQYRLISAHAIGGNRDNQCCGSMTFFGMDPDADPDPAIFVIDLQETNKKLIFKKVFLLITF